MVGSPELPSRQLRKVPDMNHCDFHYSHLLPKKPGILPLEETMTKKCRRCAAEFVTRSRIRKRCDACQTVVSAEKQKKANERLKARRHGSRHARRGSGRADLRARGPRNAGPRHERAWRTRGSTRAHRH